MNELRKKCPIPVPEKTKPTLSEAEKQEIKKTIFSGWQKRIELEKDQPSREGWTELDHKKVPKLTSNLVRYHYGIAASNLSKERKKELLQCTGMLVRPLDEQLDRECQDIRNKLSQAAVKGDDKAKVLSDLGDNEITNELLNKTVEASGAKDWAAYVAMNKVEEPITDPVKDPIEEPKEPIK